MITQLKHVNHVGIKTKITFKVLPNDKCDILIHPQVYHSDNELKVTLEEGEVFQLQGRGDFSGAKIVSSKPVGVLAGAVDTVVTMLYMTKPRSGHIVESLPPTTQWGMHYYIVPAPGRAYADIIKVRFIINYDY